MVAPFLDDKAASLRQNTYDTIPRAQSLLSLRDSHQSMQVQSNGAGASASEAMEATDEVASLQQQDQRDYQKSKGQKFSKVTGSCFQNDSFFHQLSQNMTTDCSSDLPKLICNIGYNLHCPIFLRYLMKESHLGSKLRKTFVHFWKKLHDEYTF